MGGKFQMVSIDRQRAHVKLLRKGQVRSITGGGFVVFTRREPGMPSNSCPIG